jgi:hypothetical protein
MSGDFEPLTWIIAAALGYLFRAFGIPFPVKDGEDKDEDEKLDPHD